MPDEDLQTIGAVARRTGLTVRTLHHWDDVGLVRPGARTDAGYRLYGSRELERIGKVIALRQLGFGLEEIGGLLDDPAWTRVRVLRARLDALDRELDALRRTRDRLSDLVDAVEGGAPTSEGDVLDAVRAIERVRSFYTPEQLDALAARRVRLGDTRIAEAEARWPELIAEMAEHVRRRTPPSDPRVRALAAEWRGWIDAFTGGDPGIEANLRRMHAETPEAGTAMGITPEIMALVRAALAD